MHINLMNYQVKAINYLLSREKGLLIMDAGLGKTIVGLSLAKILLKKKPDARILILTKKILVAAAWAWDNWEKDNYRLPVEVYMDNRKKRKTVVIGQDKDTGEDILMHRVPKTELGGKGTVLLSSSSWLSARTDDFLMEFDMVILDESRVIGNPESKVSTAITKVMNMAKLVYLMSAYPAPNSMLQMYNQIKLCGYDHSYSFYKSMYFFHPDNTPAPVRYLRKSKLPELKKLCAEYSLVVRKEDPDVQAEVFFGKKNYRTYPIETPKIILDLQKKLLADWILKYEGEIIVADYKIKERLMVKFLAMGNMYVDEGKYLAVSDFRVKTLLEILDVIDAPTIIIYTYNFDAQRIKLALGNKYKYKTLSGETKRKQDVINWFKKAEDNEILIAQGNTVKYGLSFNNCHDLVFYDVPEDADSYLQSQDRIHRLFQDKNVNYHLLTAKDTIDEPIHNALVNKKSIDKAIKDYIKKNHKKQ